MRRICLFWINSIILISTSNSFINHNIKRCDSSIRSDKINDYSIKDKFIQNDDSNIVTDNKNNYKNRLNINDNFIHNIPKTIASLLMIPFLMFGSPAIADDELAKFAADGNSVGVDGQCFLRKCSLETAKCANDPTCLKGLSCLARCKGGSMCSTGCFAKYGSDKLDDILYCSVEKNDCVHVPGKEKTGWIEDTLADLPSKPIPQFDIKSLDGTWYKIMGLDTRYDCFDCQRNSFQYKDDKTIAMEAFFRIPRPSFPGYLQNKIVEELHRNDNSKSLATLQSHGQMFGLTFWENWYILGDTNVLSKANKNPLGIPSAIAAIKNIPDMKLVYYTGHTLQGSYKGAFLYARSPKIDDQVIATASNVIKQSGLNPLDFCVIRNSCFLSKNDKDCDKSNIVNRMISPAEASTSDDINNSNNKFCKNKDLVSTEADVSKDAPFWYLGQRFFQVTNQIGNELADWFEDPALLSDWLVSQQEHVILNKPFAVSPFASLGED